MLADYAAGLEQDPWLTMWPAVLDGTPMPSAPDSGEPRYLVDEAGTALPLAAEQAPPWQLLTVSDGRPSRSPANGIRAARCCYGLAARRGGDAVTLSYDDLVTAATVGLTRRPLAVTGLCGPAAGYESVLNADGPAAALLDAAALLAVVRRAGVQPRHGVTVPAPSADFAPALLDFAVAALRRLCWYQVYGRWYWSSSPEDVRLLADLLSAAADAGYVAMGQLLTDLLDASINHPVPGPAVTGVLGARGRLLVRYWPGWQDMLAAADSADPEDWRTGSPAERLAYLTDLRDGDPGAARDLLAAAWVQEHGRDRAWFLAAFSHGLSLADEGFLELLLEPEMLAAVEPDVQLVSTLISLNKLMPEKTRATARQVVARVVAEVEKRIADRTRSAISGALNRAARTSRPRPRDIDWNRTIAANLSRYIPERHTVIPERLVGSGRRQQVIARDLVLAVDQSASMASSVVHASVFGAVLASVRAVRTSLVVFDTTVADLTPLLSDPVDVLFGTQLGGGTDINRAVAYCSDLVTEPRDTIFVLISDLYEDGDQAEMRARLGALRARPGCASWRCWSCPTTARRPTTAPTRPRWLRSAYRRSRAPPTRSPTCSPRRSTAATSWRGRSARKPQPGDAMRCCWSRWLTKAVMRARSASYVSPRWPKATERTDKRVRQR